jgi:hypothetical protein
LGRSGAAEQAAENIFQPTAAAWLLGCPGAAEQAAENIF